jgi:hypothetical protein
VLETAELAIGWLVYRRSLPPETRSSRLSWALLGLLGAAQLLGVLQLKVLPSITKCM